MIHQILCHPLAAMAVIAHHQHRHIKLGLAHEVQQGVIGQVKGSGRMAGNAAGFEDATRALFAADAVAFASLTQSWPVDVRDFARELASRAFNPQQEAA